MSTELVMSFDLLVTTLTTEALEIRPFQIDLLFLINLGSKNLPASQEKNKQTPEKNNSWIIYNTNTKHKILVIL